MPSFVLVPGLNANARVYREAGEALWHHGSVTIANHLEGEGVAGIAANILRDAPPRFALGGFSMGGYVAFEILRQAPERIEKLALIDTSARADSTEATENRRRRIELTRAGKYGLVVQQSFAASVHPDHEVDPELIGIHKSMAEANGPEVYIRHQRAIIARPDSRNDLQHITVPTVIIVGEADQITPVEAAREMEASIPSSHLLMIRGAGHLALLEQPAAVNAALDEWAGR
jgi:pimeloyl-ACP methyl ester carboxylesterase